LRGEARTLCVNRDFASLAPLGRTVGNLMGFG
jgi:hypothetical protein